MSKLLLDREPLALKQVEDFAFNPPPGREVEIAPAVLERVTQSHQRFLALLERRIPIYGVTTGFGDSSHRVLPPEKSEELQRNLVDYLSCATGAPLPIEASRATFLIRLKSLCLGYSGVSPELIERMQLFINKDWIPVVPREGSLGASGDLIPLAYFAQALRGEGFLHAADGGTVEASRALREAGVAPYVLRAKEGLALVNGTSAMAGLCLVNLKQARLLTRLATVSSAWLCLALQGRTEAFGKLVNEKAKKHAGQARIAAQIRALLEAEDYRPLRGQDVQVKNHQTEGFVQDRYSLRCSPQILGPVVETIELASQWLEQEINSVTDNPLVDEDGTLGMGGNFYGGYLSHGMDYLKICLANVADLVDRQLILLIDDKSNRGLPPNLADWASMSEQDRHLHHGLKGLHQSVGALTSGLMAKAIPNSIFSRSSESHNQDKVSLGMTGAVQCQEALETLFTIQTMYLVCLAQALDLRGVKLRGAESVELYARIRETLPFVRRDMPLGAAVHQLVEKIKRLNA